MSVCGLCVYDSHEGRARFEASLRSCDVSVATAYGQFPDDLSGFVAL